MTAKATVATKKTVKVAKKTVKKAVKKTTTKKSNTFKCWSCETGFHDSHGPGTTCDCVRCATLCCHSDCRRKLSARLTEEMKNNRRMCLCDAHLDTLVDNKIASDPLVEFIIRQSNEFADEFLKLNIAQRKARIAAELRKYRASEAKEREKMRLASEKQKAEREKRKAEKEAERLAKETAAAEEIVSTLSELIKL